MRNISEKTTPFTSYDKNILTDSIFQFWSYSFDNSTSLPISQKSSSLEAILFTLGLVRLDLRLLLRMPKRRIEFLQKKMEFTESSQKVPAL